MNRIEFMTTLASLLQDIPAEERKDAMQYYNDYFDEAGSENEEQVIRELGSPEKVADMLKAGIDGYQNETGEFTDAGYHDSRFEKQEMPETRNTYHYKKADGNDKDIRYAQDREENEKKERWTSKTLKIILIIAIVLCAAPIILPLVMGILAAIAGCLIAFVILLFAIVIAAVAVFVSGIAIFGIGFVHLFSEFLIGLALVGIGLIMIPLGAIATVAAVKLCIVVIPGMIRGMVKLFRKPFVRKAVA